MSPAIGIHITGTRIEAGVMADSRIVARAVTRTPDTRVAEDVLAATIFAVEAALSEPGVATLDQPPAAIGVGCPGPIDHAAEHVSPLTIPAWRHYPLGQLLTERFRLPVTIQNDAACLAIGERLIGAGAHTQNLLAVTLGAGVGGGLVLAGELFFGASGNAGHVGHMVVRPGGVPCDCSGRGCLQTVASVPAVLAAAQGMGWTGGTLQDLVAAVSGDEPAAVAAIEAAGDALGVALASLVTVLDLELVTLSGPLLEAAPSLLPHAADVLRVCASLPYASACRVVLAHPDTGLAGAAALCGLSMV